MLLLLLLLLYFVLPASHCIKQLTIRAYFSPGYVQCAQTLLLSLARHIVPTSISAHQCRGSAGWRVVRAGYLVQCKLQRWTQCSIQREGGSFLLLGCDLGSWHWVTGLRRELGEQHIRKTHKLLKLCGAAKNRCFRNIACQLSSPFKYDSKVCGNCYNAFEQNFPGFFFTLYYWLRRTS